MPDEAPPTKPISIRLTFYERAVLKKAAGNQPLSTYMRTVLLDPAKRDAARAKRSPVEDDQALAKALGLLGQSRIANNLNQLARAANLGSLALTPDEERDLNDALANVAAMRVALMQALGLDRHPT